MGNNFCRKWMATIVLAAFAYTGIQSAQALPAEGATPVNNREYGPAVRTLIQNARKSIHLMLYQARYYEEYPDTVTNRYVEDMIAARKRGVEVSIVIDTGTWNEQNKNEYNIDYVDRLTTAGVKIWQDSPNEVSHQKVLIVDDDITLVASNNWSFYSLAKNNEVAVILYSKPVADYFREYFRERAAGGQPYTGKQSELVNQSPATGAAASPLPFKKYPVNDVEPVPNRLFYPAVHDALVGAKKSIIVVQRSFNLYKSRPFTTSRTMLPGEPIGPTNVFAEDLISAHKRGVQVRVILDQTEEMSSESSDETAAYLKSHGVEVLRDDMAVQTHAKFLVIDDDISIIGSTNWTYPAIETGNEVSVLIRSPEINKLYKDYIAAMLQSAGEYKTTVKSIWDSPPTATKGD